MCIILLYITNNFFCFADIGIPTDNILSISDQKMLRIGLVLLGLLAFTRGHYNKLELVNKILQAIDEDEPATNKGIC